MRTALRLTWLATALAALAACAPLAAPATPAPATSPPDQPVAVTPGPASPAAPAPSQPYDPQPGDAQWVRGEVFLTTQDLLQAESYPPQITLRLAGTLPTPCHQLRVAAAAPDARGQIKLEVYSVADPAQICIQVLQDFEQAVPLGSFPAGAYTVWVNDAVVGEFTN
ncbi:MAG: hypothetical protein KA764_14440 [Anaerolineales bacterium]|nr:hypothetical protein [Anaerolineales bacterium]